MIPTIPSLGEALLEVARLQRLVWQLDRDVSDGEGVHCAYWSDEATQDEVARIVALVEANR
jgi:hypothetical protein